MPKPADKDILEALEFLEEEAEMHDAIGDYGMLESIRQQKALIRRLAREAGYDLAGL